MEYVKKNWQNTPSTNTPINADNLNHIEQGIYDAQSTANAAQELASETEAKLDALQARETTSTAAGMTDTTKAYIYTGSEAGYNYGHWYYWNGSAWTDGGVYNSAGVNTDTTLSVSGAPADSKATGDEVTNLKSALTYLNDKETYETTGPVPYTFTKLGGGIDNEGNITNPTSNKYAHTDPVDTSVFYSFVAKQKDAGSMYFCYYNIDENEQLVFDHRTVKSAADADVDFTNDFKTYPYVALSFYLGTGTSSYDDFDAWYAASKIGTVTAYRIDRAETNITNLDGRVDALEELAKDSYFPSTWSSGLNALHKNIGKSLVFAVQTDTHYDADSHNYTYCTPLKNLTKKLGLDFICNLGDIIRGYKADTLTESQTDLSEIIRRYTQGVECPVLVTTGNHDDGVLYTALGTGNNSLNEIMLPNELFEKMYRPTYNTMQRVTVADALNYYFVDFDRYRLIMLNTRDLAYQEISSSDVGINHHKISSVQAAWFENVALDTNKPIVVMCHVPLIDSLLPDANSVENADLILDALSSFKEGGGIVLCCCYGHAHVQNSATEDGILHIVFKNGGNFAEVVAIDVDNMSINTYIVGTQSASPRTFAIPQ